MAGWLDGWLDGCIVPVFSYVSCSFRMQVAGITRLLCILTSSYVYVCEVCEVCEVSVCVCVLCVLCVCCVCACVVIAVY